MLIQGSCSTREKSQKLLPFSIPCLENPTFPVLPAKPTPDALVAPLGLPGKLRQWEHPAFPKQAQHNPNPPSCWYFFCSVPCYFPEHPALPTSVRDDAHGKGFEPILPPKAQERENRESENSASHPRRFCNVPCCCLSPNYLGFQVCFRRRNHPWNPPRCFGTMTNPSCFPSPAPACCFMDEKFQCFHSSPGIAPGMCLPLKAAQRFQSDKKLQWLHQLLPFS